MSGRLIASLIILAAVTFIGIFGMYYLKNISAELCAMVDEMRECSEDDTEQLQSLFEDFKKEYAKYNTAMTLFADNENIFDIDLAVKKVSGLIRDGMTAELMSELGNISGSISDVYERMRPNLKNIL